MSLAARVLTFGGLGVLVGGAFVFSVGLAVPAQSMINLGMTQLAVGALMFVLGVTTAQRGRH